MFSPLNSSFMKLKRWLMEMASRRVSTLGPARSASDAGAVAVERKVSARAGAAAGWPALSFSCSGIEVASVLSGGLAGAAMGATSAAAGASAAAATTGGGVRAATNDGRATAAGVGTVWAAGVGAGAVGAGGSSAGGAVNDDTGPSSNKSAVVRGSRALSSSTKRCMDWWAR